MDRQSLLGFRSLETDIVPHENVLSVVAFQFSVTSMRLQWIGLRLLQAFEKDKFGPAI